MRIPIQRFIAASILLCGLSATASSDPDLSSYRKYHFGMNMTAVAGLAGMKAAEAKSIQSRPADIQELVTRPQSFSVYSLPETAKELVFTFYNGQLFRIEAKYDRYETEGLTDEDLVAAISRRYGTAQRPAAIPVTSAQNSYSDSEVSVATWQDADYRFELLRASYGPTFRLVGVMKKLEVPAGASSLEARRLDALEAPQREAARLASEQDAARVKLEQTRAANKLKFRL